MLGGLIPVGAGEVRLAYSTYKIDTVGADPRTNKLGSGLRAQPVQGTALYATYAHLSNKNGASLALNNAQTGANSNSNGYDFGIRHSLISSAGFGQL